MKEYVDILPKYLTGRFISATQDAVVVSGRIPDADASRLLPIVDALDNSLAEVRARHPGYSICGDRSFGDRRAKQRHYDRKIEVAA